MADQHRATAPDPGVAAFQAVAEGLLVDAARTVHDHHQRRWDATVPALQARIAELEALLEQAEDYARDAGADRDEADTLLDEAVARADRAEAAVARVRALADQLDTDTADSEADAVVIRAQHATPDSGWWVDIPSRPGLATNGDDIPELLRNLADAWEQWEACGGQATPAGPHTSGPPEHLEPLAAETSAVPTEPAS